MEMFHNFQIRDLQFLKLGLGQGPIHLLKHRDP